MNPSKIVEILEKRMPQGLFDQTIVAIKKEADSQASNQELFDKFIYPKIRQYGLKVEIKIRPMTITNHKNPEQYKVDRELVYKLVPKIIEDENLDLEYETMEYEDKVALLIDYLLKAGQIAEIKHYSLWINNQVYHWGIGDNWRVYGLEETDREITKNWTRDAQNNEVYFSLRTFDEINQWVSEWKESHRFDLENCNSQTFVKELVVFLNLY